MLPVPIPEFCKQMYPESVSEEIGPPQGYSSGEIGMLPTLRDLTDPRFPALRSYWRPSADELRALNAGGHIELEVIAYQMVPVALNVVLE